VILKMVFDNLDVLVVVALLTVIVATIIFYLNRKL